MVYYLCIPENHEDTDLVITVIGESGLNYRIAHGSDSDFIELFSGLESYVGTEQVLQRISRTPCFLPLTLK